MSGSPEDSNGAGRFRVLVVEDDPSIAAAIVRGLRQARFDVVLATNGELAIHISARERIDLVVLDLNLPDLTGFDLLEAWRSRQTLPVVVLTARTELTDRLRAFNLGAIDYLPKPFWMEELVARIRLRLRIVDEPDRRKIAWDDIVADLHARQVQRRDGRDVGLTAHEFNVLAFLLERRGIAVTRSQIADSALPFEGERQDRTVDSHIYHLRRKLGTAGQRIRTVWGIGYRFDGEEVP